MQRENSVASLLFHVDGGAVFAVENSSAHAQSSVPLLEADLVDFLPPLGWVIAQGHVTQVSRRFAVDPDSEDSLLRFESDFGLYVAEKLDGYIAVHSALMVLGDAVVIVPGVSHRGKSTLALAALEAGFRVLSDEYTLINEETGMVRGWSRPLRRRNPDGTITRIPIDQDDNEYEPTHVCEVSFDPNQSTPLTVEQMSPGDVAFSLLGNTVCAQSRPEQSLRAVAMVSRTVHGFKGTRGEAAAALGELVSLVSSSADH